MLGEVKETTKFLSRGAKNDCKERIRLRCDPGQRLGGLGRGRFGARLSPPFAKPDRLPQPVEGAQGKINQGLQENQKK